MYCVDVIPQRIYNGGQMAKARIVACTYHIAYALVTESYVPQPSLNYIVQWFRLHPNSWNMRR